MRTADSKATCVKKKGKRCSDVGQKKKTDKTFKIKKKRNRTAFFCFPILRKATIIFGTAQKANWLRQKKTNGI